jgi:hypothetical protein
MDGRKFRLTKKKEHIAYKCTVENHSNGERKKNTTA